MENSRPVFTQEITPGVSISHSTVARVCTLRLQKRELLYSAVPPCGCYHLKSKRHRIPESLTRRHCLREKFLFFCLVLVWPELNVNPKPETDTPLSSVHSWVQLLLCTGSQAIEGVKFPHYSSYPTWRLIQAAPSYLDMASCFQRGKGDNTQHTHFPSAILLHHRQTPHSFTSCTI